MKSNEYYKMCSEIKQITDRICSLIAKNAKSSKVKQRDIRNMKREYRLSRPKKTRYDYEIKRPL